MKYLLFIFTSFIWQISFAQTDPVIIKQFESRKNNINHNGMIILSSWAGANIIGNAIGYGLTNSYEEKQFYLMNSTWGIINLSIGLPGVLAKSKPSINSYELQKSQTKVEKIFLANALLDVLYVSSGFYLKEYAHNQTDINKQQRFNGFGNSIILQGAGLMAFDIAMTILNNRNRKKHLDPFLKKVSISFSGNFIKLGYRFN